MWWVMMSLFPVKMFYMVNTLPFNYVDLRGGLVQKLCGWNFDKTLFSSTALFKVLSCVFLKRQLKSVSVKWTIFIVWHDPNATIVQEKATTQHHQTETSRFLYLSILRRATFSWTSNNVVGWNLRRISLFTVCSKFQRFH